MSCHSLLWCSEKVAIQTLKSSDWQFEGAFDIFYSHSHVKSASDTRHLEELYNRYKGKYFELISSFYDAMTSAKCCVWPHLLSICYCWIYMLIPFLASSVKRQLVILVLCVYYWHHSLSFIFGFLISFFFLTFPFSVL